MIHDIVSMAVDYILCLPIMGNMIERARSKRYLPRKLRKDGMRHGIEFCVVFINKFENEAEVLVASETKIMDHNVYNVESSAILKKRLQAQKVLDSMETHMLGGNLELLFCYRPTTDHLSDLIKNLEHDLLSLDNEFYKKYRPEWYDSDESEESEESDNSQESE